MGSGGWAWGLMAFSLLSILPAVTSGGAILTNIQVTLTGTPPTTASVGTTYAFTPVAANGMGAKTFSLTGVLLGGLTFSTATGAITGVPTTAGTMSGLNITVTDASGSASLGSFSIVVVSVSALEATTLQSSITYGNAEFFFDKPMPVGRYINGTDQPFVVSSQPFSIVKITPESVAIQSGTFKVGGVDKTGLYDAHGAMIDPWTPLLGGTYTKQGFDQFYEMLNDTYTGGSSTSQPYDRNANADPAMAGPKAVAIGDEFTIVKTVRRDNLSVPWPKLMSKGWFPLHVVKTTPPLGAFAPGASDLDKTSYFTTGTRNMGALGSGFAALGIGTTASPYYVDPNPALQSQNQTTLEAADAAGYFAQSIHPFFGQKVDTRKRQMLTSNADVAAGNAAYSATYGTGWVDFFLGMVAQGPNCPDALYNRVLQFAIQLVGYYKRGLPDGVIGGAGAGQWCGSKFPLILLANTFPNVPGLQEICSSFKTNASHQPYWVKPSFIGANTIKTDRYTRGIFQDVMLNRPHWSSEGQALVPSFNPQFDGNRDGPYEFVSSKVTFPEMIAIGCLKGGKNGWNGLQASANSATIDQSVPLSAHVAYFDLLYTVMLANNNNYLDPPALGKYRILYGLTRGSMGLSRWSDRPDAFNVEANQAYYIWAGNGTATGTLPGGTTPYTFPVANVPQGAIGYDFRAAEHSYPAATDAEFSYSQDGRFFVTVPGTARFGQTPILSPATYATRVRLKNPNGWGPYSNNYARVKDVSSLGPKMYVTITGTATGTTTQVVSPAVMVPSYPSSDEPLYEVASTNIDLTKYAILYAGRGIQSGPLTTPTFQWCRNDFNTPIAGATADKYNVTSADPLNQIAFYMDVNGVRFYSNWVSIPAAAARPAGVIIDQALDNTFPIYYPNTFQSITPTLVNCGPLLVEPFFAGLSGWTDDDFNQDLLYTGRMHAVKAGQYPRFSIKLSGDVPLVSGQYYLLSGVLMAMGEWISDTTLTTQGKVYTGGSRPIWLLGKSPHSNQTTTTGKPVGAEYFSSDNLSPRPSVPLANQSPYTIPLDIPKFMATGPDLWLTIVANQVQGASGADPSITGRLTVAAVP